MSRYTIIKDGKAENFAESSEDFAQSQGWLLSGTEAVGDLWDGTAFSKPPAPLSPIPQQITMRQARLALLGAGLLSRVNTAIAALPEPDKSAALIDWEYSAVVQRDSGLVPAMGTALGMTAVQIDALFVTAAAL